MFTFTPAQIKELTNFYLKLDNLTDTFYDLVDRNKFLVTKGDLILHLEQSLESSIQTIDRAITPYVSSTVVGSWAISQIGITPTIAAALGTFIDINNFENVGSLWRHAGLDPTQKNSSFSHNPDFKSLCWKIGTNFADRSEEKSCFYGQLYLQDKKRRLTNNEQGNYSEKAGKILQDLNPRFNNDKTTLLEGKLPDAQIDAQARRYAVKIFLSHYYAVAYQDLNAVPADRPTKITVNGKKQTLDIPNNPFTEESIS